MIILKRLAYTYREVLNSIAFYPSLLSTAALLLAVASISIENLAIIKQVKEHLSFVLVEEPNNARTILSVLIGSIISLAVFSFSMVMIVLNTASSNLSPRMLPGIITKNSHQLVLGVYLGSIIYSTIVLINVDKIDIELYGSKVPSLGVFCALILGLMSLIFFVFFIHSISKEIQVDHVLNTLFKNTMEALEDLIEQQQECNNPSDEQLQGWHEIKSVVEGYYKGIKINKLKKILEKESLVIYVSVKQGYFTVKGYPFLRCNRSLKGNPDLEKQILDCFIFYIEEFISDHYSYGLKQISEIAVKAMSPGINDPGTAVKAIDMMSILLIKRMSLAEVDCILLDQDSEPLLFLHEVKFEELLHDNFSPIRHYAKSDALVMLNVLEALKNILFVARENDKMSQQIFSYLDGVIYDLNRNIHNPYDRSLLREMLLSIVHINNSHENDILHKF
ncbi:MULTISPECIES: DUF2254 domain-containing protein [Pseudoalteromonas]|uniref:DUF2254 domain-containing protein n=1 Tax=Pseudoalteromonas amylolytica TaxID=1859457 RepID=A0A1S1MSP2_9GAMM|nr:MULTISPECIES: DUF2254 domain-containing protein [Pseudoalteromonas]OHU88180.1 hypothetical protein BFC16_12390 [Pseudoalteromonas sp. JW3]OHU91620.1 hypothetical protein BET10_12510 [Pseudoalteromonas amylolytica]